MQKPPTNDLNEVPLIGHTREWFKWDWMIIKKSLRSTIKVSPIILPISVLITATISYASTGVLNSEEVIICSLALWPIFILGYFLLRVLKDKGYDIRAHNPL